MEFKIAISETTDLAAAGDKSLGNHNYTFTLMVLRLTYLETKGLALFNFTYLYTKYAAIFFVVSDGISDNNMQYKYKISTFFPNDYTRTLMKDTIYVNLLACVL